MLRCGEGQGWRRSKRAVKLTINRDVVLNPTRGVGGSHKSDYAMRCSRSYSCTRERVRHLYLGVGVCLQAGARLGGARRLHSFSKEGIYGELWG